MRRRPPGILTDYRAVLDREGDIVVGAYARVQRRRRIMVGAAGLALIGVATGLYLLLRPTDTTAIGRDVSVWVQCGVKECGFSGVMRVPRDAVYPLKCPQCKADSCRKLWECRVCHRRFLPKAGSGEVRCECGSTEVGTAEGPSPAESEASGTDRKAARDSGR